jgi:hypothetical protein
VGVGESVRERRRSVITAGSSHCDARPHEFILFNVDRSVPMSVRRKLPPRPLRLESLEGRENPSGNVQVALTRGVLSIRGDDQDNSVQIRVTANETVVTPQAGTTINGQATAQNFNNRATSVNASMLAGNDTVAIDPSTDFNLTGALFVDLGEAGASSMFAAAGDSLKLTTTTGNIDIGGAVTMRQADGMSTFTVQPGTNNTAQIRGAVSVAHGNDASTTSLSRTTLSNRGAAKVTALAGDDTLSLTDVTLSGPLMVTAGNGDLVTTVGGTSTLASLSLAAAGNNANDPMAIALTMSNASVSGPVTLKSGAGATLTTTNGSMGAVSITGGSSGTINATITGPVTTRGISLKGDEVSLTMNGSGTQTVNGAVSVRGRQSAAFTNSGSGAQTNIARGALSVRATEGTASLTATGDSLTMNKGASVSGSDATTVNFATTAPSEIRGGTFTVTGGRGDDSFTANGNLRPTGGITASFSDGTNSFTLGDGTQALSVGAVKYTGGAEADTVNLNRVDVNGTLSVSTLGGVDAVSIQNGSSVAGTSTIDTGSGSDTVSVANVLVTNTNGPTVFTGRASFVLGTGNDTLTLGMTPILPDPNDNTKVRFQARGNTADGGTGDDQFSRDNSNFEGDLTDRNFENNVVVR